MLFTQADFPSFYDCLQPPLLFAKDGVVALCFCLGTAQYWWISVGLVILQLRAVFCPLVQYLSFFCEAFSWTDLESSSFPWFHIGQVFYSSVYPLTVVLPQIFFNFTTLVSSPLLFCLFRAMKKAKENWSGVQFSWYCGSPLDVVVHFLVLLKSFRVESFPCQFSSSVARIKNVCFDPDFLFWRCMPRILLAVSITAMLKVVFIESMPASWLFMMVRGANFPLIIAWKFSTHRDVSAFRGQTWVLGLLARWFFSDEGGRFSSASRGHFQVSQEETLEVTTVCCLLYHRARKKCQLGNWQFCVDAQTTYSRQIGLYQAFPL